MANKSTLEKIEQEIKEGKLGIARDRLHGLVIAFPFDLSLRSRLGDVYWKLGYPVSAGQFWFLDDPRNDVKKEAIARFLANCKSNPSVVLRRLKLGCHPDQLPSGDIQDRVNELIEQCRQGNYEVPEFERPVRDNRARNWLAGIGCLVATILALTPFVIGLHTVYCWLTGTKP